MEGAEIPLTITLTDAYSSDSVTPGPGIIALSPTAKRVCKFIPQAWHPNKCKTCFQAKSTHTDFATAEELAAADRALSPLGGKNAPLTPVTPPTPQGSAGDCKFQAQMFNKNKCQICFKPRDAHQNIPAETPTSRPASTSVAFPQTRSPSLSVGGWSQTPTGRQSSVSVALPSTKIYSATPRPTSGSVISKNPLQNPIQTKPYVTPRKASDGLAPNDLFAAWNDEISPRPRAGSGISPRPRATSDSASSADSEDGMFAGLDEQDQAELRLVLEEEKALLAQEKLLEEKLKRQLEEEEAAARGSPIPMEFPVRASSPSIDNGTA